MKLTNLLLRLLLPFSFALQSCRTTLDTARAEALVREVYTGGYDPDVAGSLHVVLSRVNIDSIREDGDVARVYFNVKGSSNNGSAYEYPLKEDQQVLLFQRTIWGKWKKKSE